jgi:hypothetical protein
MKEEKMSDTLNRRHFIQSLLIFLGAGASIKSKLIFASKPNKNLKGIVKSFMKKNESSG